MPRGVRELSAWLARLFRPGSKLPAEIQRARDLIAAIDAGGLPLNPTRINVIARDLGLDVSRKAAVDDTVRRIRDALARA